MVQKTSWLNLRRPTWFGGHKDGLRWFAFPVACSNATSIFSSKVSLYAYNVTVMCQVCDGCHHWTYLWFEDTLPAAILSWRLGWWTHVHSMKGPLGYMFHITSWTWNCPKNCIHFTRSVSYETFTTSVFDKAVSSSHAANTAFMTVVSTVLPQANNRWGENWKVVYFQFKPDMNVWIKMNPSSQ